MVDLTIGEGTFAKAGQALMNLVSFEDVWVEAYLTENNLARVSVGDPVEIVLDLYPGRIFKGEVSSITNAASVGPDSPGSLPSVPKEQAWLRDPQRFPVRIRMLGYEIGSENADIRRNLNGQANVIVYTGDNGFLNALGGGLDQADQLALLCLLSHLSELPSAEAGRPAPASTGRPLSSRPCPTDPRRARCGSASASPSPS